MPHPIAGSHGSQTTFLSNNINHFPNWKVFSNICLFFMLNTTNGVLLDTEDNFKYYLKFFEKTEYVKISFIFLKELSLSNIMMHFYLIWLFVHINFTENKFIFNLIFEPNKRERKYSEFFDWIALRSSLHQSKVSKGQVSEHDFNRKNKNRA